MQLKRMFSTDSVKGTKDYLDTQKKYEILRTALYFGISVSLFIAGYVQTKERANLLSIVAILGCLPASKSAVGMIMFLRFKSFRGPHVREVEQHAQGLDCLYDMVFTSYKKNFPVSHLAVRGNTVCGYSDQEGQFEEKEFYKHIGEILKLDGHKNVTVKMFTDLGKYTERLAQMRELEPNQAVTQAVIATLKSVAL